MVVQKSGHVYLLQNYNANPQKQADSSRTQQLRFLEMNEHGEYIEGTTNEEVLEVLLDRIKYLNAKFPCEENRLAIDAMEIALLFFYKRTKDRISRGVEGKHEE